MGNSDWPYCFNGTYSWRELLSLIFTALKMKGVSIVKLYGYDFRHEKGHVVIYKDGIVVGHAQSLDEAVRDVMEDDNE